MDYSAFNPGFEGKEDAPSKRPQEDPEDPDHFYKILGCQRSASAKDLRKAYMKRCRKYHPDRGGDKEKFQEVQDVYDVLKDERKRKKYDKYGKSLKPKLPAGHGLFGSLFQRADSEPFEQQPQKSPPARHVLQCTLAQLFKGRTARLNVTRKVIT